MRNRSLNQSGFMGLVILLVILGLIVGGILTYRHFKLSTIQEVTFTVEHIPDRDLQIIRGSGSKSEYSKLVYTDKGVFANKDSTFPWKTRSSDVYNQLKEGKTYTCTVAGWRVGFLSMYKNLIDCDGFKYH